MCVCVKETGREGRREGTTHRRSGGKREKACSGRNKNKKTF